MGRFINTGIESNVEFAEDSFGNVVIKVKPGVTVQEGDQFIIQYGKYYEKEKKNYIEYTPKKHNLAYALNEAYDQMLASKFSKAVDAEKTNVAYNRRAVLDTLKALDFKFTEQFSNFLEGIKNSILEKQGDKSELKKPQLLQPAKQKISLTGKRKEPGSALNSSKIENGQKFFKTVSLKPSPAVAKVASNKKISKTELPNPSVFSNKK